jgi:hypothetical protein
MSILTVSSRIEMDPHRQPVETWCVIESIMGQVIADEHRGILTVISLTQEQLEEIGSDKLPSLLSDLGVHFVSRMFMLGFQGLVWSGPTGNFPMERGSLSILIIMIGHGDGWEGTTSTETFLQVQFLDSRSNGHRYFSMKIQERRIQYVCRG